MLLYLHLRLFYYIIDFMMFILLCTFLPALKSCRVLALENLALRHPSTARISGRMELMKGTAMVLFPIWVKQCTFGLKGVYFVIVGFLIFYY